jgi:hypothetical protein
VVRTREKNGRTKFEIFFDGHNMEDVRKGFLVSSWYKEFIK